VTVVLVSILYVVYALNYSVDSVSLTVMVNVSVFINLEGPMLCCAKHRSAY
jgi:hypothetical protein